MQTPNIQMKTTIGVVVAGIAVAAAVSITSDENGCTPSVDEFSVSPAEADVGDADISEDAEADSADAGDGSGEGSGEPDAGEPEEGSAEAEPIA